MRENCSRSIAYFPLENLKKKKQINRTIYNPFPKIRKIPSNSKFPKPPPKVAFLSLSSLSSPSTSSLFISTRKSRNEEAKLYASSYDLSRIDLRKPWAPLRSIITSHNNVGQPSLKATPHLIRARKSPLPYSRTYKARPVYRRGVLQL